MARQNARVGFDFTENVILGFSSLVKAEAYKDPKTGVEGKPRFNANFWLPADSQTLKDLKTALLSVVKQQFGPQLEGFMADSEIDYPTKLKMLKFPLKSGDSINAERVKNQKEPLDFAAGKVRVAAHTGEAYRPVLAATINGKAMNLRSGAEQEPYIGSHFYNGALVRAGLTLVAYDTMVGGVSAQLNDIWSTGTGDRLGGSVSDPAARFGQHVGQMTAEDPTSADEISF